MITKFDSSYYGTVDMENLGYAGTPINERRYSQAELGGALHKVVEYAKCMDERGYGPDSAKSTSATTTVRSSRYADRSDDQPKRCLGLRKTTRSS